MRKERTMSLLGLKSIALAGAAAVGMGTVGLALAGHAGLMNHLGQGQHFGEQFARLHMEFMVDRALKVAEATPEQREKIEAILKRAHEQHAQFREQHEALRAEALDLLSGDTGGGARREGLRAKHLQAAEQASKQITAVIAGVADVLPPAQRQKLAAHVRQMFE